jgi:hypothetical protein
MPPKASAPSEPSRKRARPEPSPSVPLPASYRTWPKAIQTVLQAAERVVKKPENNHVFVVIHETVQHYFSGYSTEFELWGTYKTARSANWKTAERFIEEFAMDVEDKDGIYVQGHGGTSDMELAVKLDKSGLLTIEVDTGEGSEKVYVVCQELED